MFYDKFNKLKVMIIKKQPVRVQFLNAHIEPSTIRFEIFKTDSNVSDRLLEKCGLYVPVGSVVVLVFTGENNDYLVFSSVETALEFCRMNNLI